MFSKVIPCAPKVENRCVISVTQLCQSLGTLARLPRPSTNAHRPGQGLSGPPGVLTRFRCSSRNLRNLCSRFWAASSSAVARGCSSSALSMGTCSKEERMKAGPARLLPGQPRPTPAGPDKPGRALTSDPDPTGSAPP